MKMQIWLLAFVFVALIVVGQTGESAQANVVWTERDLSVYCTGDLDFVDDKFGGNVCAEYFYTTKDAGRTWDIKKIFGSNGRPYGMHAEGLKFRGPSEVVISGTYVYRDAANVTQNEIVIQRSTDGGNTFTETVLDKYDGKDRSGSSMVFLGDVGAFSRLDGSAVYYTKDGGQTWLKTEPSGKNLKSKISILPDGTISIARLGGFSRIDICNFDTLGSEKWTCVETFVSQSRLAAGATVVGLAFLEKMKGVLALGREQAVVGGLLSLFGGIPNLKYTGSCYDVRYIDSQKMVALCMTLTSRVFGSEEEIDFLVSTDGGSTWTKEYHARHPYMKSVLFETHTLSNGTTEIFLTDSQRFNIGTIQ